METKATGIVFCFCLKEQNRQMNILIMLLHIKIDHRGDTEFQKNQSVQVQDPPRRLSFYQMHADYFGK